MTIVKICFDVGCILVSLKWIINIVIKFGTKQKQRNLKAYKHSQGFLLGLAVLFTDTT